MKRFVVKKPSFEVFDFTMFKAPSDTNLSETVTSQHLSHIVVSKQWVGTQNMSRDILFGSPKNSDTE